VRNRGRKALGVALAGVLGALFAVPMLAAGAQTDETPAAAADCVILSVNPNPAAAGQQVTVSGTAPNGADMVLYADGIPAVAKSATDVVTQLVTDNTFALRYTVDGPTELSANFTVGGSAYVASCADPSGEVVVKVAAASTNKPAGALAFTGSSDTPSYVLVGIAALALGAVLVVAARRRSHTP
jgi:LPXTG-motif cell wall-anchored protein